MAVAFALRGRACCNSGGAALGQELTLGHILKTFVSHDCDLVE
jgi:hypothetical protein